jgi:hypothetical protein
MNIGVYGILVIFGAFVLLMVLNPNLSCFGKRLKSPLYPLMRKRGKASRRQLPTEDYGFDLGGENKADIPRPQTRPVRQNRPPTEDYGFNLHDSASGEGPPAPTKETGKGSAD